jgi:tight adherence protein C
MGDLLLPVVALAAVVGAGLFIATLSLTRTPQPQTEVVMARLRSYEGSSDLSLQELELGVPFIERVVRPAFAQLAEALARRTPTRTRQDLNRLLNAAGRPFALTADEFVVLRYAFGVAAGAVAVLPGLLRLTSLTTSAVLIALAALIGYFAPLVYVRSVAGRRRTAIARALPDALDLLQIAVEAGLSLEAAMTRVAAKHRSPLAEEFTRVLQETRLGRPRLEALEEMVVRCQVEDLSSFVQAVIQSQQLGTPIATILRIQAAEIRQRRLVKAQLTGARASLKMLLPMVGCIFPTIWVILLGPAILIVLKVFK